MKTLSRLFTRDDRRINKYLVTLTDEHSSPQISLCLYTYVWFARGKNGNFHRDSLITRNIVCLQLDLICCLLRGFVFRAAPPKRRLYDLS